MHGIVPLAASTYTILSSSQRKGGALRRGPAYGGGHLETGVCRSTIVAAAVSAPPPTRKTAAGKGRAGLVTPALSRYFTCGAPVSLAHAGPFQIIHHDGAATPRRDLGGTNPPTRPRVPPPPTSRPSHARGVSGQAEGRCRRGGARWPCQGLTRTQRRAACRLGTRNSGWASEGCVSGGAARVAPTRASRRSSHPASCGGTASSPPRR